MKNIVWLASYPKSGNTWFRAFLANLQLDPPEPININELKTGGIASGRAPLDRLLGYDSADLLDAEIDHLRSAMYLHQASEGGPLAYIKVHDAYTLLDNGKPLFPPEATRGILYIIRNPLDVCVSYLHHAGKEDCDKMIANMGNRHRGMKLRTSKYQEQLRQTMLSWSEHARSWVDAPDQRVHVMRYEDMVANPEETFGAAARFADLPHEPARIKKALFFSSFEELKRQEETGGFRERLHFDQKFFRKGKTGSWRETLTQKQAEKIIADHAAVMTRFGYLSPSGEPLY